MADIKFKIDCNYAAYPKYEHPLNENENLFFEESNYPHGTAVIGISVPEEHRVYIAFMHKCRNFPSQPAELRVVELQYNEGRSPDQKSLSDDPDRFNHLNTKMFKISEEEKKERGCSLSRLVNVLIDNKELFLKEGNGILEELKSQYIEQIYDALESKYCHLARKKRDVPAPERFVALEGTIELNQSPN